MLGFFNIFWKDETPRQHVLGFYDAMEPFHKANCRRWFMNLNMQIGNQYAAYDNDKSFSITVPRAPSWRKRAQFNKILPLAISQRKKLLPNNPTICCRPANTSDVDKANAIDSQQFLRAKWKEQGFQKPLKKTAGRMVSYGVGYLAAIWDGRAGVEVAPGVGTGDLIFVADSPFELVPDYSMDDFDEMPRYVRVKVRSVDYIKHKYGVEVKPEKLDVSAMFQLRAQALATKGEIDINKALDRHAMVYEMWELPSVKYPNGFHWLCTREADLSKKNPAEINLDPYYERATVNGVETKKYFLPPDAARLIPLEDVLITTCSVEQATGKQCFYNEGKSQIQENATRLGRPKAFVEEDSIADGSLIEDPAEIKVEYKAGTRPPIMVKPPEMAQYHLDNIRGMVPEMQDDFGIHDATQGVLPRRATSGKAISFLVGQDEDRHTDPREELDAAIESVMRKALNIAANAMTEERMMDLVGEDGKGIVQKKLKMQNLRAVDVTITRDVNLPKESAARWDLAVEILDRKPTQEDLRIMFALMKAQTMEDLEAILTGNSQAEETYALMENHDFNKLIWRPVAAFENHVMHEKTHSLLLRNPKSTEAVKAMVNAHIDEHRAQNGLEAANKAAQTQGQEELPGEEMPPEPAAAPAAAAAEVAAEEVPQE